MWNSILKALGLYKYSSDDAYAIACEYFKTLGDYNKRRNIKDLRNFLQAKMTKKQIKRATREAYLTYFIRYSMQEAYDIAISYIYKLGKIKKKAKKEKMYEFLWDEMLIQEIQQSAINAYENYFIDDGGFFGRMLTGAGKVLGNIRDVAVGVGGAALAVGSAVVAIGGTAYSVVSAVDDIVN